MCLIGTVKFATQVKESPCSPGVTFPNFGSKGHRVQPPQGNSVFFFFIILSASIVVVFSVVHAIKPGHINLSIVLL